MTYEGDFKFKRDLKLSREELSNLFWVYDTTRITKTKLAKQWNISRPTLDAYIANRVDICKALGITQRQPVQGAAIN